MRRSILFQVLVLLRAIALLATNIDGADSSAASTLCILHSGPKFYLSRFIESIVHVPSLCSNLVVQTIDGQDARLLARVFPHALFLGVQVEDVRTALWSKTEAVLQFIATEGEITVIGGKVEEYTNMNYLSHFEWPVLVAISRDQTASSQKGGSGENRSRGNQPASSHLDCEKALDEIFDQARKDYKTRPSSRIVNSNPEHPRSSKSVCEFACKSLYGAYADLDDTERTLGGNLMGLLVKISSVCECHTKPVKTRCTESTQSLDHESGTTDEGCPWTHPNSLPMYVSLKSRVDSLLTSDRQSRGKTSQHSTGSHLAKDSVHGFVECSSGRCAETIKRIQETISVHDMYYHYDDDTYVFSDNLRRYISDLRARNHDAPFVSGRLCRAQVGFLHPIGGPGYLISLSALRVLRRNLIVVQNIASNRVRELNTRVGELSVRDNQPGIATSGDSIENTEPLSLAQSHESLRSLYWGLTLNFPGEDMGMAYYSRLACQVEDRTRFEIALTASEQIPLEKFRPILEQPGMCSAMIPAIKNERLELKMAGGGSMESSSDGPWTVRHLFNHHDILSEIDDDTRHYNYRFSEPHPGAPASATEAVSFHMVTKRMWNTYESLRLLNL